MDSRTWSDKKEEEEGGRGRERDQVKPEKRFDVRMGMQAGRKQTNKRLSERRDGGEKVEGKDGGGTRKGAGVSQSDGEPMADLRHKPVERIAPIGFRTGEEEGGEENQYRRSSK